MRKIDSPFVEIILFSLIGLGVGFVLIFFETIFQIGESTNSVANSSQHITWIASIILKISIWFAFIPSCYAMIRKLLRLAGCRTLKEAVLRSWIYSASIGLLVLVIYLIIIPQLDVDMKDDVLGILHSEWKNVWAINILGFLVFIFPLLCISLLVFSTDRLNKKQSYQLSDYFLIRETFQSIVLILGVFLSLLVLTIGLQQQVNPEISKDEVVAYAVLHAFIMAVIYFSGKISLIRYGGKLRDYHLKNIRKHDKYIENYEKLTESLSLDDSLKKNFLNILSVISPLLTGSLLPALIEKVKDL